MTKDAPIPGWAKDRLTLRRINVAIGAALTALLATAAFVSPTAVRSVVDALFSPWLLLGLATILLVVAAVRRLVLGPAHKQEMRRGALLVTYFLAALPLGVAGLMLGTLVTLSLVFQWQTRFALVQSFLLLLVGFVVFSMTVKTVLNAQMLMRHWFGR